MSVILWISRNVCCCLVSWLCWSAVAAVIHVRCSVVIRFCVSAVLVWNLQWVLAVFFCTPYVSSSVYLQWAVKPCHYCVYFNFGKCRPYWIFFQLYLARTADDARIKATTLPAICWSWCIPFVDHLTV